MSMPPLCTVIVVAYNHANDLPNCLEGILAQEGPTFEIIVVDNASQDATLEVVRRYADQVTAVRLSENQGFAVGNNAGAGRAQGEILIFLNPDTAPQPGWLANLVAPLLEDESIGMTTSQVVLAESPHLVNTCGNDITWTGLTVCRGMRQPVDLWQEAGEVGAVSGAACAIRRTLFEAVGGFDESFFLYYEDTDLSLRVRLMGYCIWYMPSSVVLHRYAFRFSPLKAYYQERNRWLALLKTLRASTILLLLPGLLLGELMAWIYAALSGPSHLAAKVCGWLWLLRHWRLVLAKRDQVQRLRSVSDRQLLASWSADLTFTDTVPDRIAIVLAGLMVPLLTGYGTLCRKVVA